jgi:hypothetical protein
MIMRKTFNGLLLATLFLPFAASADSVLVTRHFTGLWDQVEHESQGINLQIIDQADGSKVGVAYWFTYAEDMESAWFFGVGPVDGNRIDMVLYEGSGIGFLEANAEGNDRISDVGRLEMEFFSCTEATATFTTVLDDVGSGSFPVERFTDLYNTSCSGGVSDDTPPDTTLTEQRIALAPARAGVSGSGHADFEERPDRTEFSVEAEDLPNGTYRILVGGVDRGELVIALGVGETEFRSPVETGKVLLTFDPRGLEIEVHDAQGAVLTSGDGVIDGGDDNGNGGGGGSGIDFGTVPIEVELSNTGVYSLASGDAKLDPREDRTDFSVEIEDVPVGSYTLRIGGAAVGTIVVVQLQDGSIEGEIEFRDPVEPGKVLLDFDPRGQQIDVLEGDTVILETLFPES